MGRISSDSFLPIDAGLWDVASITKSGQRRKDVIWAEVMALSQPYRIKGLAAAI
jgi:hypothetical protein